MAWPDSMKKQVCKYLLQHYIGNFLQEELRIDQLNVDLYNGKGFVENLVLDIYTINEMLQSVHAPIEILKGTVGSVTIFLPWSSIMNESCVVEVKGLRMIAQPMYRTDAGFSDLTDSFYASLKSMTTSMQLAQEGLQNQEKKVSSEPNGMKLWTYAIDSVLRRVKVKFTDATICFEHISSNASSGVGLELSVDQFEYSDEDSDKPTNANPKFQDKDAPLFEELSFSCKQFCVSGLRLSMYQFCDGDKGPNIQSKETIFENLMLNPVLIAECFGEQKVKFRVKQNDEVSGPKVDAELYLGSCCAFLTPKQVHLLLDFIEGFTSPLSADSNHLDSFPSSASPPGITSKPMTQEDFRKIEGQLTYHDFQASRYSDCDDESQDSIPLGGTNNSRHVQFYSMGKSEAQAVISDKDYYRPIDAKFGKSNEIERLSPQSFASTQLNFQNEKLNSKNRQHKLLDRNTSGTGSEDTFRFQINLLALSLTILHVDPMEVHQCKEQEHSSLRDALRKETSSVDKDCVSSHHVKLVSNYFLKIKKAMEKPLTDLFKLRTYFAKACAKHDHLRILAGPLHFEYERTSTVLPPLSSSITKMNASIGNLDFLECLYDNDDSQAKPNATPTYVGLLIFPSLAETKLQSMHASMYKEQAVKIDVEVEDSCDLSHTTINLHLSGCKSEVDISIADRLNALFSSINLKAQNAPTTAYFDGYSSTNNQMLNEQAIFQKALDDDFESKQRKVEFEVVTSQIQIEFRFPIPDLRPEIQKRPWFQRSLRDEVLFLTAKDLVCNTSTSSTDDQSKILDDQKTIYIRFRDLCARYADEPGKLPKLFLRTSQSECDQPEPESDYDWPFIQIHLQPNRGSNQLCCEEERLAGKNKNQFFVNDLQHHFSPHESNDPYSNDDFPMFNSFYETPQKRIPSPFSQRKVHYNNAEMILPGDEEEIQSFVDHASATTKIMLALNFPVVQVSAPSKCFVESLYNRIGNDLLLWEPVAPQPTQQATEEGNTTYIPSRLDFASQFFSANEDFHEITQTNVGKSDMHVSFMTDDDASYISKASNRSQKVLNQSLLSVSLAISRGSLSLCSAIKSDEDTPETGLVVFALENGSLFTVSRYHSNPNVDYACIQVDSCQIYHKIGLLSPPVMHENSSSIVIPPSLNSIIHSNEDSVNQALGCHSKSIGENSNKKMITVVIKIELDESRYTKHCTIASQIQQMTMHHQFLPPGHSWLEQLMDFFDIEDTPVLGYEPPSFITEVHFHVNDCAVDYKPLHLPSRAVATLHSFSLSSNVVANSPSSILQIFMDNIFLYISDNGNLPSVDLQRNFVNVLDVSLLELSLRLSSQPQPNNTADGQHPLVELVVENSRFEMRTCVDSCATFAALLRYIAADGDITLSNDCQQSQRSRSDTNSSSVSSETLETTITEENEVLQRQQQEEIQKEITNLMADAMQDVHIEDDEDEAVSLIRSSHSARGGSSVMLDGDMITPDKEDNGSISDDDFCIIVDPNEQSYKDSEPEVEYLIKEHGTKVEVVENHFAPVLGKADVLRAPEHFPASVMRYVIRELSCSWYMYGGNDFASKKLRKQGSLRKNFSKEKGLHESPKHKPSGYLKSPHHSDRKIGGFNRNYKVLMEFHLMKVRFQHETYRPEEAYASRTVFTITDFEIRDRLDSSQINKFLYHYHNEASPKQSHANMLLVKALLVKPAPDKFPECRLKVSLQPLRLNIDQDSLTFLTDFFTNLSSSIAEDSSLLNDDRSSMYGTALSTAPDPKLEFEPAKAAGSQRSYASLNTLKNDEAQQMPFQPLFFREFVFSPDVPIRLDYHGKHIDIEQGKLAGLLMGLGQLNCSQLKLRKIVHRHGLLGIDRVVNFALNNWAADIRTNQLPSILGGVGPLHSVVQFFQGVRDLVWLPVEQYRKDGRIVRGLQKGTSSFGTSTSMAVLEITNRFVWLVQTTAETACDIISPVEFQRNKERQLNTWRGLETHARRKRQPTDLREGFNNAVTVVQHGVTDTANSLARVAQKEHERKGLAGAVGGVIRHIPLTLVRPVAFASEATSNVLSGMRNQILPDAKREDEEKWRDSAITN